jgi:hypothetical protein
MYLLMHSLYECHPSVESYLLLTRRLRWRGGGQGTGWLCVDFYNRLRAGLHLLLAIFKLK